MGDRNARIVFIHETEGKVAPEDQRRIRSRCKPRTYRPRRLIFKGSGAQIGGFTSIGSNTVEALPPPRLIPHAPFADDLDPGSLNLFSVWPSVQLAFSVRNFGVATALHSTLWREWQFTDATYLHALLATSSAVQDSLREQQPSRLTRTHLSKAMEKLKQTLSTVTGELSDAALASVLLLCATSIIAADRAALVRHFNGLQSMIRLVASSSVWGSDPQCLFIMTRIELLVYVVMGLDPIFRSPIALPMPTRSWPQPHYCVERHHNVLSFIRNLVDRRVASVFETLHLFAHAANGTASDGRTLSESGVHSTITLAQIQLIRLAGALDNIMSECLRLTLLAFLTTTFQLRDIKIHSTHAADRLRELCLAIEASTPQLEELLFWILTIGRIGFFHEDETWLRYKWQADVLPITEGLRWDQAREILRRYVWIDRCNSDSAAHVFGILNRR
ncbi:hypothetical protein GGR57DRAFT_451814 [Xylariaceae sp. FL1272]|nr:hypothetical protein GGR57DRAFT_451814 [Xylariaceae sp. FL1272]